MAGGLKDFFTFFGGVKLFGFLAVVVIVLSRFLGE